MIVNKNHITKKLSLLILMIFNYSCIAQVNKINSMNQQLTLLVI